MLEERRLALIHTLTLLRHRFAINQETGISQINLTYNQICSLSQAIHAAIDKHYQEYSNSMQMEKTQSIYFDDPVDW